MSQYTKVTDYYDLLMTQGYYDYQAMADAVYSLMKERHRVLELGVGTGLLAEKNKYLLLNLNLQESISHHRCSTLLEKDWEHGEN